MKRTGARNVALDILHDVIDRDAFLNISIKKRLQHINLSERDKRLVTELTYGTLEYKMHLDWVIKQFTKGSRIHPIIRNILRLGIYQILFLDRIPDPVACNESVLLTKQAGKAKLSGFVNGVLRSIVRNKNRIKYPDKNEDPVTFLSIYYSYPYWLVQKWVNDYGLSFTEDLLSFKFTNHFITVRPNTMRISLSEWERLLDDLRIPFETGVWVPTAYYLQGIGDIGTNEYFRKGLFSVQGESSMLAVQMLSPQPEQCILDACSAPGGKATYIAELMGDKGKVIAWDIHPHRVKLIEENKKRLGLQSIIPEEQNAEVIRKDLVGKMDGVLVDAPCSGLGVIHKKPDIKYRKTPDEISELSKLQFGILQTCSQYVKPGGILVYSTCTIAKEENEEVVDSFLKENRDFYLNPLQNRQFPPGSDPARAVKGYIQLFPHLDNMDGFFIAVLKRK
ncbi:MAG: 16S rRNA (cytosine(967)-C(5))-methyltransferase RsmB [Clostridia bacterium]